MVPGSLPKVEALRRVRRINSADDSPIWLATAQDGIQVAVKHVTTPVLALAARAAFSQRLEILLPLQHPHVTRTLVGQIRHSLECVVVSTYYPRGSLLDALSPGEQRLWPLPLPLPQAARLIGEIALGISALHERDLPHGGLKLTNIFLFGDRDGMLHAQVGDVLLHRGFGGVPWRTSSEASSPLADPLLYVAPEQYARRATFEGDQFALATIAFVLLTGSPPYSGDPHAVLRSGTTPQIAAASSLNPTLPVAADRVLQQGMAWSAQARFDSTKAFAVALARALAVREPDRVLDLPPQSIPMANGRREAVASGATQPHEVLNPLEPLATLRPAWADADVIDPHGLPSLPPNYQWTSSAVIAAAAQPASPAVAAPAPARAKPKIPPLFVTATMMLAIFLLSAIVTALGALVLLGITGH
jgi:serine/threonine protein kinase